MIDMSRLLFALWVVLCFVPDYYPAIAESESYSFIEQYDFDNKTSSASHKANGLVVWVEIAAPWIEAQKTPSLKEKVQQGLTQ